MGAAVALKFAKTYPVVVLARKLESYATLVSGIKERSGFVLEILTDESRVRSIKEAFMPLIVNSARILLVWCRLIFPYKGLSSQ
jgi:hypothetical protein